MSQMLGPVPLSLQKAMEQATGLCHGVSLDRYEKHGGTWPSGPRRRQFLRVLLSAHSNPPQAGPSLTGQEAQENTGQDLHNEAGPWAFLTAPLPPALCLLARSVETQTCALQQHGIKTLMSWPGRRGLLITQQGQQSRGSN